MPANNEPGGEGPEVRERIFASALRHFSRKGYAATSLREIADEAQTTKPMIYYYFGSKDGLYGSIVHEILEEMATAIRCQLPGGAGPRSRLLSYCESYVSYFLAKEETIALVLREVFGLGGAPMAAFAQTLGADVRRPLDDILREGMEAGAFVAGDVNNCATALTGILNMFILARVFAGAEIETSAAMRQIEIYVQGLANPT